MRKTSMLGSKATGDLERWNKDATMEGSEDFSFFIVYSLITERKGATRVSNVLEDSSEAFEG